MDAAELARWTRFAAKGGIGKCTAVQDCVAESPEDLMFLKDDEITVLMQLSNQPGFYLGYCEGVVGRFQGDHVRFHGKLKRPIMTKRASASAVSVASSPVPSVTPSPRIPLSPLSNSTPSTGQAFDRDSRALSDPFDLELDAPPPPLSTKPRRSGSDDAVAITSISSSAEPGDGDRRPRRMGTGDDDLPGLEMFLPRSRSHSGSRSRPPSRGQQGEDEKKSQRRQTRIMTPPQPPFATSTTTTTPRKDSLEIPPSSSSSSPLLPHSPQSPLSQTKQQQQQGPFSSPSPTSSPVSPMSSQVEPPTQPASGSLALAPLSSPGRSELEKDKYNSENVRVGIEEGAKAVEFPAVSASPEPLISAEPEPEPESDDPVRVESPARDESSLYDAGSMRSSIYSTRSSYRSSVFGVGGGNENEIEIENENENGNGNGNSMGTVGLSGVAAVSDAFARLSQAESDDGGFGMGIGLSMLQGMADDEDEDEDENEGEGEGEGSGDVGAAPPTRRPPPGPESKENSIDERKEAKEEDVGGVEQRDEKEGNDDEDDEEYDEDEDDDGSYWDGADIYDNYRYSRFSMMTKASRRKSRFSVMSRMSVASGGGGGGGGGGGIPSTKKVPPVPLDAETRLRADSVEATKGKDKEKEDTEKGKKHVPPPLTLVKPSPSASTATTLSLLSPAATKALSPATSSSSFARFSAAGSDQLSPLLHTSFASPRSSASQNTSYGTDESDRSPESHAPNFVHQVGGGVGGAASALRQRLEHGRSASSTPLPSPVPQKESPSAADSASDRQSSEGPGTGIVVEDDESVNVTVVPADEGNASSNSSPRNIEYAEDRELARDSMQSAVSTATTDSTATSVSSNISDVSGVMRKIEQDLASVSAFSVTAGATAASPHPPPNIRATLAADAEGMGSGMGTPTPTATEFSVGTTQPLRVQDRAGSRLTPSPSPSPSPSPTPDPNPNRALSHAPAPPSPSPRLQPQQLPVQQDAKSSQGPHLLRPEQALFPPHPNAPRPNPAVLSGQRQSTYGMPPLHEPQSQPQPLDDSSATPPELLGMSLEAALRSASASRMGPAGVPHRSTIYGKTVVDLASADGPVAIVWSLSPFPPDPPPSRQGSPAPGGRVPRRAATAGASPLSQSVSVLVSSPTTPTPFTTNNQPQTGLPPPPPSPVTSPPPRSASPAQTTFPRSASPSVSDNPTPTPSASTHSTPNVLLRPNFQPRVGVARPRSRSFSDIAREVPAKPILKERSSEEGSQPSRVASFQSLKEAAGMARSNKNLPVNGQNAQTQSSRHSSSSSSSSSPSAVNGNGSPPKRGIHTPSPLSRPENNAVLGTPRGASFSKPAAPSSPLARSFLSSSQSLPDQNEQTPDAEKGGGSGIAVGDGGPSGLRQPVMPAARMQGVRQVASVDNFKMDRSDPLLVGLPRSILQPIHRNSGPATGVYSSPPVPAPSSNATSSTAVGQSVASSSSPIERLRRMSSPSSKRHERSTSQQSQASSNSELRSAVSPPPNTSSSSTPSPVQRNASLKSKLSLSHLRIRHTGGKDSLDTQTTSPSTGPQTPVFDYDNQPETVQVQDAEFEMIRPTMRRFSAEPASEEFAMGQDERPSLHRDSSVESPIFSSARSLSALSGQPSTIADSTTEQGHTKPSKPAEDAAAHRTRELKWMTLLSSVPASQARKSKKIRKLLLEGVPSSVRYLVWSHLADSKAKRIPGVYGQLGRRGRVAASEVIERDAARCFSDQPHLQDPKGPLVGLLQTYLTMVPDIEYQTSLSLVAGHLLLQSPEEDGFWTFTSIMDCHLRGYFSSKSVQIDADAIIFGTSVELTFPQLAKKLFKDLSVSPGEIFRAWFPSLFATTLPQDYVNRIWDVYLYDGPPFLFRVALAILSCCRSAIESSNDRMAVLAFLIRPETLHLLPDSPDEFINIAFAIKLKDEDIRKHRAKVEADLRHRRSQSTHRGNAPRLVSSISLPRAGPVPAPPL